MAEIAIAVGVMKRDAWELMLKIIQDECGEGAMMLKLRKVFEEKFRYDDKGLPIIWKPGDDVDAVFAKAKIEVKKR